MAKEIERKFLVKGAYKHFVTKQFRISQGFLSTIPERTVRVRVKENKAFLTIKGIGNESGMSRYEFETELTVLDATDLLKICEKGTIEKTRYIVPIKNGLFFEVDEFYGDNQGLIIAEIELPTESTFFEKPAWLGEEVTGETKYYNSVIMKNPFKNW